MRNLLPLIILFFFLPQVKAQISLDVICADANQALLPGEKLTCIFNYLDKNVTDFPDQAEGLLRQTFSFIETNKLNERVGEFYYYKGMYFLEINHFDSARYYFELCKNKLHNTNFELQSQLYRQFSVLSRKQGKLKDAFEYVNTGFQLASKTTNQIYTTKLLLEQGYIYSELELYTEALNAFNGAQKKYKQLKDTIQSIAIYIDIARLYSKLGNHPLALDYLDRGMMAFNKLNYSKGIGCFALFKGEVLFRMGNYEKALVNYQIAHERFKENNLQSKIASVYFYMGQFFLAQKKFESALTQFGFSLKIKEQYNDNLGQSEVFLNMGDVYSHQNDLIKAQYYYTKSLAKAEFVSDEKLILELYQRISDNYYKRGDFKSAIDYKSKAQMLENQLLAKDHYLRISDLELKLAAQINERGDREKELLGSVYRERALKNNYFKAAAVLLVLLFIVSIYYFFAASRFKKKAISELKIKQHRINRQKTYLKNTKEQLDVLSKKTDTFFNITTQNIWEPVKSIEQLVNQINGVQSNSLKIALLEKDAESLIMSFNLLENLLYWSLHQLNKIEYEPADHNLAVLLKHNLDRQKIRAKAKEVSFKLTLDEEAVAYFDMKQIEIAIRNLIENAIKFSTNGDIVSLNLKREGTRAVLTISDSGIGFTKEQLSRIFSIKKSYKAIGTHGEKGGGIGLMLAKLFIEKNFGSMQIESSIAKGTTVIIKLPVSVHTINNDSFQ